MSSEDLSAKEADILEAKIRSDATLHHDERTLPVNTDAPLPLTVKTLRGIPQEKRQQYVAEMDGETFSLRWIHTDDSKSMEAHEAVIAKGGLRFYNPTENPQTIADRQARGELMAAKALALANTASVDHEIATVEAKYLHNKQGVQATRDADIAAIRARYNVTAQKHPNRNSA